MPGPVKMIATYDIKKTEPEPHEAFREQAEKLGWRFWLMMPEKDLGKLPNTTMCGLFTSRSAALKSVEKARLAAEAQINGKVIIEGLYFAEVIWQTLSEPRERKPAEKPNAETIAKPKVTAAQLKEMVRDEIVGKKR